MGIVGAGGCQIAHHFLEKNFLLFVKSEQTKKPTKNDIRRRTCSQKSDVPHKTSSMYFLLELNIFFLVFHETLIISQRAATKVLPRAYQCMSDNCINFAVNVIIPLFVNIGGLQIHVCLKMRFFTSFDINLLFSNFLVY